MALQNLRTSVAHKRPIPTLLSAGQIAVNTNEASPALFFKDSNGDLVKVGPVHIGTAAPNSSPAATAATALVTGATYQILTVGTSDFTLVGASANTVGTIFTATGTTTGDGTVSGQQGVEKGEMWLDTTGGNYVLKIYDGTAWRSEVGEFVNISGDTMTGALLLDNAASASAPDLSFDGDANTGIYSPGADQFAISTGGNGRVFIDSSGNLGVGTSSVSGRIHANSAANTATFIAEGETDNPGYPAYGFAGQNLSNGTRGAGMYLPADNTLAFSTAAAERMRIDGSGNIGINTSSPGYLLDVNGVVRSTGSSAIFTLSDRSTGTGDRYGIYSNNNYLRFYDYTAAQDRVVIDSSGNVGVGTSSPSAVLVTRPASAFSTAVATFTGDGLSIDSTNATAGNGNYGPGISWPSLGASVNRQAGISSVQDNADPNRVGLAVFTHPSSSSGDPIVEAVRISSSGNVGIGTSSPNYALDVASSDTTTGIGYALRLRANATAGAAAIQFTDNPVSTQYGYIACDSSSNLKFTTGLSERMRIDSSGNVGIGTSSPPSPLSVTGTWAASRGIVNINAASGTQFTGTVLTNNLTPKIYLYHDNTTSLSTFNSIDPLQFIVNASERMRIDSSGYLLVGKSTSDLASIVEANGNMASGNYANNAFASGMRFYKSKSGTVSVHGLVSSGTQLGDLRFLGSDGTQFVQGVSIRAEVDGTPGANDMPGRLLFSTTADGASSPTERMRIDSSGNIGVGTSAPTQKLHVNGNAVFGTSVALKSSTATVYTDYTNNSSTNIGYVGDGSWLFAGATTDFGIRATNNLVFGIGAYERMRIDSSGRVLIGTSSARSNFYNSTLSSHLQLEGTNHNTSSFTLVRNEQFASVSYGPNIVLGTSGGSTSGSNTLISSTASMGGISWQGTDGSEFVEAASIAAELDGTPGANDMPGRLIFRTTADGNAGTSERMRITANGDFGFNTSVIGGAGGISIIDGSNGARQLYFKRNSTTNISYPLSFNDGATNVGSISFTNTTTSYNTSSDYRLKENIIDIADGITRVKQLAPKRFNFIADTDTTVDGFVAHEVQNIVPEAITGEKDAVDDDGNAVYQGIDQSKLVPLLTAALQEAIAKIETLEQRLNDAGL